MDTLQAMFDLVTLEIDNINEYRLGGGLERVVETSERMAKLGTLQINILIMMANEPSPAPLKFYGDIYKPEQNA